MIYSTVTVPVNRAGEPMLSREQIWKGLVLKARDARLFLPPGACTKCRVIVEDEDYIIREATIAGEDLTETITFEPMSKVSFHQFKGPREGVIVNELREDTEGALQLRFYALLGLKNVQPGGPEEMQAQAAFDSDERGYKAALLSTLRRTRALLQERKL